MMSAQPIMNMANDQIGVADMERIRSGMQLEEIEAPMQTMTVQGFMSAQDEEEDFDQFN